MRRALIVVVAAIPVLLVLLGLWLGEQEPPCADWLDGPCSPDYSPFGAAFFVFWLGVVGIAMELVAASLWTALRYRRRRVEPAERQQRVP